MVITRENLPANVGKAIEVEIPNKENPMTIGATVFHGYDVARGVLSAWDPAANEITLSVGKEMRRIHLDAVTEVRDASRIDEVIIRKRFVDAAPTAVYQVAYSMFEKYEGVIDVTRTADGVVPDEAHLEKNLPKPSLRNILRGGAASLVKWEPFP